ncbi:MAG: hypothetical protein MI867_08910 [Pseudomonadales bacterium]|nr:hypothetical protein [Pseudomonadales bacterium]
MSNYTEYLKPILFSILAALLSACGGNKITGFSPADDITMEASVSETLAFAIEGPAPEEGLGYQWNVKRFNKYNEEIETESLSGSGSYQREYQVTTEDEEAFYTQISASFGQYIVIGGYGGFPITIFRPLSTVTWEFITPTNQTQPIFVGDAFVRNQNDLERLRDFETITGDILITDPDISSTDALSKLTSIQGNILATKVRRIRDFTPFQFNDQLQFNGKLSLIDNVTFKSFEGLGFIQELESLILNKNDALDSLAGMTNLTAINSMQITLNPSLKSLEGLETITGSVQEIELWGNTQLERLSGLDNINHIERLSVGAYPSGGSIPPSADLVDLTGLTGLTSIGELVINEVETIESLQGLENLQSADSISIVDNPNFSSIGALSNLTQLDSILLAGLPGVSNLDALSSIQPNIGTLHLFNLPILESLQGLSHIESIEDFSMGMSGQFNRFATYNLIKDFTDLESLTRVGSFRLNSNIELLSLAGLENLLEVGLFALAYNPNLSDVSQLSNLQSLNELIWGENEKATQFPDLANIEHLDLLSMSYYHVTDLNGLRNLRTAGEVSLRFSETLSDASALSGLESVSGDFRFSGNHLVTSLDLRKLQSVGGEFAIVSNLGLEDINVSGLQEVGGAYIFYGNRILCTSTANSILDQILSQGGVGDYVQIENNAEC